MKKLCKVCCVFLGTSFLPNVGFTQASCEFGRDMIIISDVCVAAEKVGGFEGSQTGRCTLSVTAPEGFILHPELMRHERHRGSGEDKSRNPVPTLLSESDESDFFLRAFPKSYTQNIACKTGRGAGSSCRVGAAIFAAAIRRECFSPGSTFSLQ
jgi:hypothetical protein